MDPRRFDTLAKTLSTTGTRRGALATLLAGSLGLLGLSQPAQGRKRRGGGGVTVEGPCGDGSGADNTCRRADQCCTGICERSAPNKPKRCQCRRRDQPCTETRNCCQKAGQALVCDGGTCKPSPCDPACGACERCVRGACETDPGQAGTCCEGGSGVCNGGVCEACDAATPICDAGQCVECTGNGDCTTFPNSYCDTTTDTCACDADCAGKCGGQSDGCEGTCDEPCLGSFGATCTSNDACTSGICACFSTNCAGGGICADPSDAPSEACAAVGGGDFLVKTPSGSEVRACVGPWGEFDCSAAPCPNGQVCHVSGTLCGPARDAV